MKHTKRILTLCVVSALLMSLFAMTGLFTSAGVTPYDNGNYTVVRDFTQESHIPWEGSNSVEVGTTRLTNNEEDAQLGTPSPDGAAVRMVIGDWAKNDYGFTGLNFAAVADAEAIVFWYKVPYAATFYVRFSVNNAAAVFFDVKPTIISFADGVVSQTVTSEITADDRTGLFAPLKGEGYVVITAEELTASGTSLQDVVAINMDANAMDPWQWTSTHWYADDIGYVKDLDAFVANLSGIPVMEDVADKSLWASLYDDNVTVLNDFNSVEDLPAPFWGQTTTGQLANTSGTFSPDGYAAALPIGNATDGFKSWYLRGNYAAAPADAEAVAFWYYMPYLNDTEVGTTGITNMYFNVGAVGGQAHNWAAITDIRPDGVFESIVPAPRDFNMGKWGFIVVKVADLTPDNPEHTPFGIKDIYEIALVNGGYNAGTADHTLFIDELIAIRDLDAFKAKVTRLMNAPAVTVDGVDVTADVYDANTGKVDLSAVPVDNSKGYFLGWYNGETPFVNGTEVTGDIALEARYLAVANAAAIQGVQVRLTENSGLRFIAQADTAALAALSGVEYGILLQKADDNGAFAAAYTLENATTGGVGSGSLIKVPAAVNFDANEAVTRYTAVLTGMPAAFYSTEIAARAYVTYTDANGVVRTYYSNEADAAYYAVTMKEAAQATVEALQGYALSAAQQAILDGILA